MAIKRIIDTEDVMMGTIRIGQALPNRHMDNLDPFLLLHHAGPKFSEPGREALYIGPHPHRGFMPVTFVLQGEIHHRDSLGNDSLIKAGGVQWVNASAGIIHSEASSKGFNEEGGTFELIQLWINLPAKLKMQNPSYQGFQKEDFPVIRGEGYTFHVISGNLDAVSGPLQSPYPVTSCIVEIEKGHDHLLNISPGHEILFYQISGHLQLDNDTFSLGKQLVTFEKGTDLVNVHALADTKILLLMAPPIGEKVVSYGPYVMNDQTQIMEAMRDYQMGKMGFM